MRRRADLIGYAGVVFLAAAAMVRLLFAGSGPVALGLAAMGVALFVAYIFLAEEAVQRFLSRRSTRAGGNVLGSTIFVLGIAVLVNILALRWDVRRDVTRDKLFTLAPETREALREAPSPLEAWVLYPEGDPAIEAIRPVLEAAHLVRPDFRFHVVDPERDPVPAMRFGLSQYATVVQAGDRHESFSGGEEEDFLSALVRASRGRRRRVAFLRGHGERLPHDRSRDGLYAAGRALDKRGYGVFITPFDRRGAVPDSVDVLVVCGPEVPLTAEESDSLRAWIARGGRLFLLLDPEWPVKMDSVLARFGVRFQDRFLEDPEGREPKVIQPAEYSTHPVVRVLRSRHIPVLLPGTGEVKVVRRRVPGVRQSVLLRSGSRTRVVDAPASEEAGKRPLAVAVQWTGTGGRKGRLVVVGDADFPTRDLFPVLGNGDFFLAAVQWLAEEESRIHLRPRPRSNRPVVLTRQQGRAWMVLLVGILPLAVLLAGGITWWRRR